MKSLISSSLLFALFSYAESLDKCPDYNGGCSFEVKTANGCLLHLTNCNEETFEMTSISKLYEPGQVVIDAQSGSFQTFIVDSVSHGSKLIVKEGSKVRRIEVSSVSHEGAEINVSNSSNVEEVKFYSLSLDSKIIAPGAMVSGNDVSYDSCLVSGGGSVKTVDNTSCGKVVKTDADCDNSALCGTDAHNVKEDDTTSATLLVYKRRTTVLVVASVAFLVNMWF